MHTNKFLKLGMIAVFAVFLAACQSSADDMSEPADTSMDRAPASAPAVTRPADTSGGLTPAQIRERDTALATTVFYFEFDRADLSAEAREALVHHANRLMQNSSLRYRLEGHADERGTREYNLALGERRAQAIERYLQVQGVSSNQLEIISYGEERPVDRGTSEAAYARNRRVEIQ
tara:strand:- start:283 stop:810 length:528 start_codon:yes stop_codon:yes gene_type:complete